MALREFLSTVGFGAVSALGGVITSGTASFADSNGVSFGVNGQTLTASHNGLTSQSNQAASGSNGSFTFQTLSFSNANGLSFGTSAGPAITASYTVPTVTNSSWTVSDNATSGSVARLAFTNQNGVTLSLSTGAGGSHTIVGSHNGLTSQSNQAVSGSNGSFTFQTVSFSNANGISFGSSAGPAITASHNGLTSQSTQFMAMTLGGNTAGTTTFHATNNASLFVHGGNNITLSGNGSSVTISGAASVSAHATMSRYYRNFDGLTTIGTQANNSHSVAYVPLFNNVTATRVDVPVSVTVVTTTNNSSAAYLISATLVLLTQNASTLSSVSSTTVAYTVTWSSNNLGALGSATGGRALSFALNVNATPGNYYAAVHISTRATGHSGAATTSLGNTFSVMGVGSEALGDLFLVDMNATSANSSGWFVQGLNSSTGNITQISISNLTVNNASAQRAAFGLRFMA